MIVLQTKIERALAFVHAAIENPNDEPVRVANDGAAEVLDELDGFDWQPQLRGEVERLTMALQTLRRVLTEQTALG